MLYVRINANIHRRVCVHKPVVRYSPPSFYWETLVCDASNLRLCVHMEFSLQVLTPATVVITCQVCASVRKKKDIERASLFTRVRLDACCFTCKLCWHSQHLTLYHLVLQQRLSLHLFSLLLKCGGTIV